MEDKDTMVGEIAALAVGNMIPQTVGTPAEEGDSKPFVALPPGYTVKDMEWSMSQPLRPTGSASMHDVDSFIAYVNRHSLIGQSAIYGTKDPMRFVAVFNDSIPGEPGWRDHMASYLCPRSTEWGTWTVNDGKSMSQETFATFVEDNAPDFVDPPAADMLEIARTLEAKKKVNFASAIRLDNGQAQFTYEETIDGTAGKGRLQIPQEFTIGIGVLEGGDLYSVTARLRYRINETGKLSLWYDLLRPHKVVEDAFANLKESISSGTSLPMFSGTH